jgi:hypothetical protein
MAYMDVFTKEDVFFMLKNSKIPVNSTKTRALPIDGNTAFRLKYMYTFCGIKKRSDTAATGILETIQ